MLTSHAVKRGGLIAAAIMVVTVGCPEDEKVIEPPVVRPDLGFGKFSCTCIAEADWEGFGTCSGVNVWFGCEDDPVSFFARGKPASCWSVATDEASGCPRPVVDPDCAAECPPEPDSGVAPPPDMGFPDSGAEQCTCIDMSAWQGFGTCECSDDLRWGCSERPQSFRACDVPPTCWETTVDVSTGCVRPRTATNCIEQCIESDAGQPPADAGEMSTDAEMFDVGQPPDDDAGNVDAGEAVDSGTATVAVDAGEITDSGDAPVDGGSDPIDGGETIDAGTGTVAVDAGDVAIDSGTAVDSGSGLDVGSSMDATTSTSASDGGASDGGSIDVGTSTSGDAAVFDI